ncbi:MAG TPA: phage holin family protein, partial [Candidatus Binatia bacterium]|nr:phage holin family protein [Candidatus Binatia bacterium]
PGILHSLRALSAALASAFHTRVELFVTELEEERERLKQALIFTLLLVFGLSMGLILLTIFLVALFWQQGWIGAIGALAFLYLGIAAFAAVRLRDSILKRPGLFPATLAELGKDSDRLKV